MDDVQLFLDLGLWWLPPEGRVITRALVERRGYPGGADYFAAQVGLRNRSQLTRVLHRNALPSLEELATWVRLLTWLRAWELEGTALSKLSVRSARDASPMYRSVGRIADVTWGVARSHGSDWAILKLMERCQELAAKRGRRVSERNAERRRVRVADG